MLNLSFRRHRMKKRYPLRISRGVSAGSENLFVSVEYEGQTGLGEVATSAGPESESCDTAMEQLSTFAENASPKASVDTLWKQAREAGVRPRALAAFEIALWDALGKKANLPLHRLFGLERQAVPTSITIGIEPPEVIRERVPEMLERTGAKFLKIKLGSPEGIEADQRNFLASQECAAPFGVGLRVDANGGWSVPDAIKMCTWLAERGVDYVEQPLAQGNEDGLPAVFQNRPLPIFVDESCHFAEDVPKLAPCVDGVNLKLMKCGGLGEALRIVSTARAHGLGTMIGCFGDGHVSISAGASIGAVFDHIDLDSQLNLMNDPTIGAEMVDGIVLPPDRPGHGAKFIDA